MKIIKSIKLTAEEIEILEAIRNRNRKFNLSLEVGKLLKQLYEQSQPQPGQAPGPDAV